MLPDEFCALVIRAGHRYGVSPELILGTDRHKNVAMARHVAAWVARDVWGYSYPELGRFFGGRDHTTLIAAVRRVEKTERLMAVALELRRATTGAGRPAELPLLSPLDWSDLQPSAQGATSGPTSSSASKEPSAA